MVQGPEETQHQHDGQEAIKTIHLGVVDILPFFLLADPNKRGIIGKVLHIFGVDQFGVIGDCEVAILGDGQPVESVEE